jgi:osmoprotectant transport system ATP-binding protein
MNQNQGYGSRLFTRIESLNLTRVSKQFQGIPAVRDLSLAVNGGELIALIGGSGSGKTTTLRMINRLIEPDFGVIQINDTLVSTLDPIALRRSIGYVIQQIGLFPHMSVAENITIPLRLAEWTPVDIKTRIDELLTLVSLPPDQFRSRRPSELSGGQQQRVGLARALAADPPLLLMDEPFGALDPLLRRQLQEEFIRIKAGLGKTILFVTHDIDEAFLLGDRVAVLHEGSLHAIGTPAELLLAAHHDPYLSYLTGGDRLCRIRSSPVSMLALKPGTVLFFAEQSDLGQIDTAIQTGEFRVALIQGSEEEFHALLPGENRAVDIPTRSPVLWFSPDTTIQEALSLFAQSPARVAIIKEGESRQIILLEDLIMFLSGARAA